MKALHREAPAEPWLGNGLGHFSVYPAAFQIVTSMKFCCLLLEGGEEKVPLEPSLLKNYSY